MYTCMYAFIYVCNYIYYIYIYTYISVLKCMLVNYNAKKPAWLQIWTPIFKYYISNSVLQHKYDTHSIFMEAIALCLLLNELNLFSRTKHRFILIQIVPLRVCCTFRPVLKPSSGDAYLKTVGV